MSKKTEISISVTVNEIRAGLQKLIGSEHSQVITEAIIENLAETEVGLIQLYRAMSGIKDSVPFRVMDEVWVNFDSLPTWRMDRDKMGASPGLIFKDRLRCTIGDINLQKADSIYVKYRIIDSAGIEKDDTYWVNARNVHPATEDPFENDKDVQDGLPF
jgi:hypothetical protein